MDVINSYRCMWRSQTVSATGPAPAAPLFTDIIGGSGQASLFWDAPTLKADGSVLPPSDIVGYYVRRYNASGDLVEGPINVGNVTSYVSADPAGDWEYTAQCESVYGVGEESARVGPIPAVT